MAVLNIFFSLNVQNDNELKTSYHIDERFCRLRLHCSPHQQKYPSVKSPIWIFIRSYFLNLFSSLVFFTPSWCLTNLWQSFTGGNRVEDSQCTLLSVKEKRSYNSFTDKELFLIGKYASGYDPTKAIWKFKKKHPHLKFSETTARAFHAKYKSVLKYLPELCMDVVVSKKKAVWSLVLGN